MDTVGIIKRKNKNASEYRLELTYAKALLHIFGTQISETYNFVFGRNDLSVPE